MSAICQGQEHGPELRSRIWEWRCQQARKGPLPRDLHRFAPPATASGSGADLVFHAPSGRFFRLSPLAGALLRLSLLPDHEAHALIPELVARYGERLVSAFRDHAEFLRYLREATTRPPAAAEAALRGELLMFGNLTCNMACPYCLSREARAESQAGRAPKLMSLETAYRSIRFLAERMAGRAEHLYVNFTLGGEPLLAFPRYRHLREYCARLADELGIPITLHLNTNGTAFTDAFLEYCRDHGILLAVSIDGPREIHDAMRPLASGAGTYDLIVNRLPDVLNSDCPGLREAAAGAVLTARNPHPRRVYQHLIELGFRHVVVTPVRDFPDLEWSLNRDTVKAFKQGYTEYAEWLLDCLVNEDDRIYAAIIEHDFFARYLIRLILGTKQPYRCEAARSTFGVDIDGGLYPCDHFIKLEEFRLGDVFTGIDEEKRAKFLEHTSIDEKPVCKDCWARYQCGGGCYFAAAVANGDHRIPHAAKCDLIRHCVELCIWILVELEQRNPQAMERLINHVRTSPNVTASLNA